MSKELLFSKTLQQYDRLKARGAFLEQFKKEKMFSESLDEFDSAREVRLVSFPGKTLTWNYTFRDHT